MHGVVVRKQRRIPVHSEQSEVKQKRIVVNPEDSVIHLRCRFRIVSQQLLQFHCPMDTIEFGVVSFPATVRPWIL